MEKSWKALELLISTIIVLILLTLAYLLIRPTTPNVAIVPTVEPLPTFGIPPEVRARIDTVANTSNARYLCPEVSDVGPIQLATCIDCIYYAVDKLHALSPSYIPPLVTTNLPGGGKMRPEVDVALTALFAAAQQQGLYPTVTSAYRSFSEQYFTFQSWVATEKRNQITEVQAIERAARYSARAGHSEHQLGTAVDINCSGCSPFDTNDPRNIALWAFFEKNAQNYGFAISYPRGVEALTGYQYEPWHLRYIGADMATQLYNTGYVAGNGVCLANFLRVEQQQ